MNYSIEAEQALLGACLTDPTLIEQAAEKLTAESFFNKDNQATFQAIVNLTSNGKIVDIISVAEEVAKTHGDKLAYLYQLAQASCSTANVRVYRDIISDSFNRRSLSALLSSTINDLSNASKDTDLLISSLAGHLGAIQGEDKVSIKTTNDILKNTINIIDERFRSDGQLNGLSTGLDCLDKRFHGLRAGNLIVIAARPGLGKTVVAWQIGISAAMDNKNVLVFSLEMTAEELMQRALANIGHIDNSMLERPNDKGIDTNAMWDKLTIAGSKIKDKPITVDETPALHINQICARARAKHRIKPLDLVIVDHIGLAVGDGERRDIQMGHISGKLKALAKELNCPVIAVSQLSRKVEDRTCKRPMMSDLRDSGSIEQDADKVILLYREDYYDERSPNKGIMEVITGKNRGGETGTDLVQTILSQYRITDVHPDYQPQIQEQPKRGYEY